MPARATALSPGFALGRGSLPRLATGLFFLALFWNPLSNTVRVWFTSADAGHGLLLAPLAIGLAWQRGIAADARPQPWLGLILLTGAVAVRYLSALAAELFTMRLSVLAAVAGLVVFAWGWRQIRHWWLPTVLLLLCVPLPEILLSTLALPLQMRASQMGAALLEWRHVPVALAGNVIRLPAGQQLFVTEACSGLRSLSALIAVGVLVGGIWLRSTGMRVFLALIAVPIAMVLNAVRVFLTGFSVHYIDPAFGAGVMHYSEGWVMFVAALLVLGGFAWLLRAGEEMLDHRRLARIQVTA